MTNKPNMEDAKNITASYWLAWLDGLEDAGEGGKHEHIAFWVRRVVESFTDKSDLAEDNDA